MADDADARGAGVVERFEMVGAAGRRRNQVRRREGRAGLRREGDFQTIEQRRRRRHIRQGAHIRSSNVVSLRDEELHARESGFLHSDHEYVHLSFSVVSAKSARTKPTIQKRTMIFDSDQPSASKWWWMGAILKMRLPRSL